jgi:hypothetical protein
MPRISLFILGIKGSTSVPIYLDISPREGFWRSIYIHQKTSLCALCGSSEWSERVVNKKVCKCLRLSAVKGFN